MAIEEIPKMRKLKEVIIDSSIGKEITKSQVGTGNFPAIRYRDIYDSKIQIKGCVASVDEQLIKKKQYSEKGDILIVTVSNMKGTVGKAAVYWGETKCLVGSDIAILKSNQNPRYLSYALSTDAIRQKMIEIAKGSALFHVYIDDIKKLEIPIYSLETQEKIVRFLDKFLDLERELQQELENRKKQFEYYKNLLFNKGIKELNWELKSLKEIVTEIISGHGVTRAQLKKGDFPAIKCGDINSSLPSQFNKCISFVDPDSITNKKYFEKGDILMSNMGGKDSVGKSCLYLGNDKCLAGDHVVVLKSNQNTKYLSYALSTDFTKNQIQELTQIGIVFEIHKSNLKKIQLPLPSLEEQNKIVEILDKLYKITNDINDGIPYLIRKNREQYDFYKESLIQFL